MNIENNIKEAFLKTEVDVLEADIEEIKEHVNKRSWKAHETASMFRMNNYYTAVNEYGQHCPSCRVAVQRRCRLILEVYDKIKQDGTKKTD